MQHEGHRKPHPRKRERVVIKGKVGMYGGVVTVVDWFDREVEGFWEELRGNNRLATSYANRRSIIRNLPKDDEVVIVYDSDGRTLSVHDSELESASEL